MRAERVEVRDCILDIVHHHQTDLWRAFPFPLGGETLFRQRRCGYPSGQGVVAHDGVIEHECGDVPIRLLDDMQSRRFRAARRGFDLGEKERHEFVRAGTDYAADVQCVAHLAIKRIRDCRSEASRVRCLIGDDPGAAGAVEAGRNSALSRNLTELGDRGARTSRDRKRQSLVGEQCPGS
jgi:hypothetical protein